MELPKLGSGGNTLHHTTGATEVGHEDLRFNVCSVEFWIPFLFLLFGIGVYLWLSHTIFLGSM